MGQLHLLFTYSTILKSSQAFERQNGMRELRITFVAVKTYTIYPDRPPGKLCGAITEIHISLSLF